MNRLVGAALAISLLAAAPTFAADPPYKIPPGQYCKGVSKTKIAGQKKTPFAQCVKAMAQINKTHSTAPSQACVGIKKNAKGTSGKKAAQKAFKACVQAGKKLKLDLANA